MDACRRYTLDELLTDAPWMRALALRLARGADEAADLEQEAWMAAVRRPPDVRGAARPWLRHVVENLAHLRRRGDRARRRRELAAARLEALPATAELVERAELRRVIVEAVLALAEPYRSTVLWHAFEGVPLEQIARERGLPPATVRSHLFRAHEHLRAALDRSYGGERRRWAAPVLAWAAPRVAGGTSGAAAKIAAAALVLMSFAGVWWVAGGGADDAGESAPRTHREGSRRVASSGRRSGAPNAGEAALTEVIAASAPVRTSTLATGRVVTTDGQPIGGARLVAFAAGAPVPATFDPTPAARSSAVSAADGHFALNLDLAAPYFRIVADAAGHAPNACEHVRPGDRIVIALDPGLTLEGTVRDLARRPIAGAAVTWSAFVSGVQLTRRVRAEVDGRYAIPGLPASHAARRLAGFAQTVIVEAEGHAPLMLERMAPVDEAPVRDFYLTRGASLAGRALDAETLEPIADAELCLWSSERTWSDLQSTAFRGVRGPHDFRVLGRRMSAGDGSFRFEHAPAWGVTPTGARTVDLNGRRLGGITANAPGYARSGTALDVPDDGAEVGVDVLCWPAAKVCGRVLDTAGRAVPGARVAASSPDCPTDECPSRAPSTSTDEQGRFELAGIPARRRRSVPIVLHASTQSDGGGSVSTSVQAGGSADNVEIILDPAPPMLEVRVADAGDRPIWGAQVELDGGQRWTDRDGVTRLPVRASADMTEPLRLRATAPGFAPVMRALPRTDSAPDVLRVRLEPGRSIAGRVTFHDGRAAAHHGVTVSDAQGALRLGTSTTDLAGCFTIADLPEGSWTIAAEGRCEDGSGMRVSTEDVRAGIGDVVLVYPPRTAPPLPALSRFTVMLRDATGAPVLRACVELARPPETRGALGIAPGEFCCGDLAPGPWILSVVAPGFMSLRDRDVEVGAQPGRLEISLERGVPLRGVVELADGRALRSLTLFFENRAGSQRTMAARNGAFAVEGVRAGERYRIWAVDVLDDGTSRHYAAAIGGEIRPSAADAAPAIVRLFPAGCLALRFPYGETPEASYEVANDAGVIVDAPRPPHASSYAAMLPAGRYRVRWRVADRADWEREVDIHADEHVNVEVGP
jgi:RNA polymerase sigma factor (sigma-70 family)